jgi:hypothetical protein
MTLPYLAEEIMVGIDEIVSKCLEELSAKIDSR